MILLPRTVREKSVSNVYHIIFRGNDKQDIFYDDQDRLYFLEKIIETKEKFNYEVYAYCLMDNHIHLIIKVKDNILSKAMQSLEVRYVAYFNKRIQRCGHLFENRFYSKRIEFLSYFLNVCRYVHRNPEKANMEKTDNYKWSSFNSYISQINNYKAIVNTKVLLHYFDNNIEKLKKFTLEYDDKDDLYQLAEFELISKLSEDEICDIIKKKFNLKNASDISLLGENEKSQALKELKNIVGTSQAQISRVTRLTKYYINKIWKDM